MCTHELATAHMHIRNLINILTGFAILNLSETTQSWVCSIAKHCILMRTRVNNEIDACYLSLGRPRYRSVSTRRKREYGTCTLLYPFATRLLLFVCKCVLFSTLRWFASVLVQCQWCIVLRQRTVSHYSFLSTVNSKSCALHLHTHSTTPFSCATNTSCLHCRRLWLSWICYIHMKCIVFKTDSLDSTCCC